MAGVWAQPGYDPYQGQDPATFGPVMAPAASPVWAKPQEEAPPSVNLTPQMGTPKLDLHANLPKVFAEPQPVDPLQANINNDTGALAKVRHAEATPWGTPENHPGKLGKIGHVLSEIGNVAGNIAIPGVMANIPGSQANMQLQEEGLAHRLNSEVGQQSENNERGANAAHLNAETPEVAPNAESTRKLQGAQTENLESETANRGNPADPYMAVYKSLTSMGMSPQDALAEIEKDKALALKPPSGEHVNLTLNGKPTIGTYHPDTGKTTDSQGNEIANPEPYERPQVTNVNAADASLDREAGRLGKPYEKGISDADAQLDKIADARTMVNGNAEAQALGIPKVLTALVSGQGSGVRITMPELQMIATARGLSGDVQGTLNAWAGKGKLTPTQQKQLTGILDDVKARIVAKQQIHSDALDRINGAASREDVIAADKQARQRLNDVQTHGFYIGQQTPKGKVAGFTGDGKVLIDDGR